MSRRVVLGTGSCGIAAGVRNMGSIIEAELKAQEKKIPVSITGCVGMCYLEPIIDVFYENEKKTYVKVDGKGAVEIAKAAAGVENKADKYLMKQEDIDILAKQHRITLGRCGIINPEEIKDYVADHGYESLERVLTTLSPQELIDVMKVSGLGGRGGAGFPTWFKWQMAKNNQSDKKYVICNADEGDPGAFMDRAILEGDPHALIEGMILCGYAIGSDEGVIYVRAEYPLAIRRLEKAIADAEEAGYLGSRLFGTDFNFSMRIKAGAGAFVCGEETALIASLEGERGMPRLKPPFPAEKGFWAKPSNINNVETFANVPWILRNGGEAFAVLGTENSKGTKVFALTGKINKGGLVEIPMGSTIEEVIFDLGGGIRNGKEFKAVQMGGPSGGCIPKELIHTQIDYKSLSATGAIMGSGGMVVMDESTCMVDMARFFLDFTCKESCGKCTHCRIGTKRMLEILERITLGEGRDGDIELLEDLGHQVINGSLCGLGQTAPNPVLTGIRYFRNEFEDHIYHKKCTAGQCKELISYSIDPVACTGCSLCALKCPSDAITGEHKKPYTIDMNKCTKCDNCYTVCNFAAVIKE